MTELEFWTKQLREAEPELEAARTRTELNAPAKQLMLAKGQLKRLEGAPA